LENVEIVNEDEDGIFLRAEAAGWGNEGSNGGHVTMELGNQEVNGDMEVDEVSSLNLYLKDGSVFNGSINEDGEDGEVYVEIQEGSKWILSEDSYITSLTCSADSIDLNGHKLYVNGTDISTGETAPQSSTEEATSTDTQNTTEPAENNNNGNPPQPPTDSDGNPQQPPTGDSSQQPQDNSQPATQEPAESNATDTTEAATQNPTNTTSADTTKSDSSVTPAIQPATKAASAQSSTKTVTKKSNTITAKSKTKTVKAQKVEKSKVKVKNAIKVSNAKGKVTYTKLSGSKKLSINKKTGTITVKKGTKKGTYKIKVKVTAKGNSSYKAKSKTVTVKVKVK
jgi:hypothetical protein